MDGGDDGAAPRRQAVQRLHQLQRRRGVQPAADTHRRRAVNTLPCWQGCYEHLHRHLVYTCVLCKCSIRSHQSRCVLLPSMSSLQAAGHLVGSSSSSMEGLMSSSWPMDTRFRSPPDTPRRK